MVEKDAIIDGSRVAAGDAVIGLASSGPHSNGYSLIRKLIDVAGASAATQLAGRPLFDLLLTPTRIYVKSLLELIGALPVHALAHITGGGLTDNIPRVLRAGLEVVLQRRCWPRQPVFDWLARTGAIEDGRDASHLQLWHRHGGDRGRRERGRRRCELLQQAGEQAMMIGEVRRGERGVVIEA